ncbi:hypothetical protein HHO41_21460 [Bacillus sp. DNRA2]|uniref:hypothetical protein n=1 Tax=Bacillus sp. DNRA2 TaxID=2723053 RepID=UPI00145DA814|nr:hypothetical protein [Bacillus sp. DNRA2]NMD72793.1 hypothetical protein [Bacillus sp. DNRA2]
MGDMTKEAKESRNQYMRRYMRGWRQQNKDKIRKYNEAYWSRKASAKQQSGRD